MGTAPETPLRQVRVASGLSLNEVARRTGINKGRLSIIERGVPPTLDESRAILQALQVEPIARKPEEATNAELHLAVAEPSNRPAA